MHLIGMLLQGHEAYLSCHAALGDSIRLRLKARKLRSTDTKEMVTCLCPTPALLKNMSDTLICVHN